MERIDLEDRKYRTRMHFCQKQNCQPCQQGQGHGPYWYAYERVNGRVVQRYLGKTLPAEVLLATGQSNMSASTPEARSVLHISLLGTFRMQMGRDSSEPITHASLPQVRRLLGFLLTCPQRSATRSEVCTTLWPHLSTAEARLFLRKTVHALATMLLATIPQQRLEHYFQIQDDLLCLSDQAAVHLDADEFERLLTASNIEIQESQLVAAYALYRGDFLCEERRADWAESRRETLRHAWISLSLLLVDRALARHAPLEAIEYLQRLLATDPLHAPAVERLMMILTALDRRGEALRVYERFAEVCERAGRELPASLLATVQMEQTLPARSVPETAPPIPEIPAIIPQQRTHAGPCIGRTRELAALSSILHRVAQGQQHQRLLCLTGEAGIGKTRLVEEILSEVQQRGWNSVWSRTYGDERRIPYRLWSDLLQQLLEHLTWPWEELRRRINIFRPLITLLPALAEQLPQAEGSVCIHAQDERLLWEAVHALLILLSATRPLVVVLDDLHWADSASCQLLTYLLHHLHPTILLLATCRDQELSEQRQLLDALTEGQHEHTVTMIALPPLEEQAIATIIHEQSTLPPAQIHTLAAHASGNPFFAEELARQAQHQAQSSKSRTEARAKRLPETIQAVLSLRLSHLSGGCQRLLSKAAVLGRSFALVVIAALEVEGAGMAEETLLDLLDEALRAGILSEQESTTAISYQFWHPLLVSHLLEELSAARRASYHRQAVLALKQIYQGPHLDEQAATIVHHLIEGGSDACELAYYAERAGDRAYLLSVYSEASYYYQLAVQHQEQQQSVEQHVSLLERLGECAMVQGQYPEARQAYEQALSLLDAGQKMPQRRALLLSEIGWTWRYTGDVARSHEQRRAAELLLAEAGISAGPARASLRYQESNLYLQEGRYQNALQSAQEALALFEAHLATVAHHITPDQSRPTTRIERTLAGDPVNLGRALSLLATIQLVSGQSSTAVPYFQRALSIFETQHCLRETAIIYGNLGDVYLRMARHQEAQLVLERSLEIAQRIGDRPVICVNLGNLALLAEREGAIQQAETLLRQALQHAQQVEDAVYMSIWAASLAGTLGKQRKFSEAITYLRLAFTQSRGLPPCIARTSITLASMQIDYAAVSPRKRAPLLIAARKTIQRVLLDNELEPELNIEGQLLLARILVLQRDPSAHHITTLTYMQAQHLEFHWLAKQLHDLIDLDLPQPTSGAEELAPDFLDAYLAKGYA